MPVLAIAKTADAGAAGFPPGKVLRSTSDAGGGGRAMQRREEAVDAGSVVQVPQQRPQVPLESQPTIAARWP